MLAHLGVELEPLLRTGDGGQHRLPVDARLDVGGGAVLVGQHGLRLRDLLHSRRARAGGAGGAGASRRRRQRSEGGGRARHARKQRGCCGLAISTPMPPSLPRSRRARQAGGQAGTAPTRASGLPRKRPAPAHLRLGRHDERDHGGAVAARIVQRLDQPLDLPDLRRAVRCSGAGAVGGGGGGRAGKRCGEGARRPGLQCAAAANGPAGGRASGGPAPAGTQRTSIC